MFYIIQSQHRQQAAPFPHHPVMQALDELLLHAILFIEKRHFEEQRPSPYIRYGVNAAYILDIAADSQALDQAVQKIVGLIFPYTDFIWRNCRIFL